MEGVENIKRPVYASWWNENAQMKPYRRPNYIQVKRRAVTFTGYNILIVSLLRSR